MWCLAAQAAVSFRKLPSGSAVLHSFSVCASAAVLSDAVGRQKLHCYAPRPRCAVIASASCAHLCGASESCGQTARISDACQCSANQAHLLAVTIQPPIPMRFPSARASAAAKQCSSGFWRSTRRRSWAKQVKSHCSASLLSWRRCSSARCGSATADPCSFLR